MCYKITTFRDCTLEFFISINMVSISVAKFLLAFKAIMFLNKPNS